MTHKYNERNVCIECGCSKTFVESSGVICVPVKPEIQRIKPKLQYSEIAFMVGTIKEHLDDMEEVRRRLFFIKDKSANPAIIDWVIEEYMNNKVKWNGIEAKIEANPEDVKYADRIYKPNLCLEIECNTLKAQYRLLRVLKGSA